jgi:excisionase family DNA binding protein
MSQEVAPAMSSDNDHKILSVAEAAKVLRIGRNSCYELVPRGEIPAVGFGRTIRVPRTGLLAYLERAAHENLKTPS